MPSLATTKLTPHLTTSIPPLFQSQRLSTLSILPLHAISNHPSQQIPSYFAPSRTYLMTLPSSHVPHLLIGLLTMDTCIIKDRCMFHLPLGPPYSTPYILLHSRVTLDDSAPKRSSNVTSGCPDSPCLSTKQGPYTPCNPTALSHQVLFSSFQATLCRPHHQPTPFPWT